MATRGKRSHQGAWGLALLAGVVCILATSAQARVVIQVIGLQRLTESNTLLKAQIKLLNTSFTETQKVCLKTVEMFQVNNFTQWQPRDTDEPMDDPNSPYDMSKTKSCRGWIRLGQSDVEVGPLDFKVVPVTIEVARGSAGIYCAGIVVSVPPYLKQGGVVTGYEMAIPVLLDIDEKGTPALLEPRDYALEIESRPIGVFQDPNSGDPYHNYTGSMTLDFESTFCAPLTTTIIETSPAGGAWSISLDKNEICGTKEVTIRVTGKDVQIDKLVGGSKSITVARITIQVIPWLNVELPKSFWKHLPRKSSLKR